MAILQNIESTFAHPTNPLPPALSGHSTFNLPFCIANTLWSLQSKTQIALSSVPIFVQPFCQKMHWAYSCTPGPWFVRFSLVRFSFVRSFKRYPKYLLRAHSFIGARNNEGNKHQWKQWAPIKTISTIEGNKHQWKQWTQMKAMSTNEGFVCFCTSCDQNAK